MKQHAAGTCVSPKSHVVPVGVGTRRLLNPLVACLASLGISLFGSRILAVRGRKTGQWRTTPVNPLELDGQRYLFAPRGHVAWTKNLVASGAGELRLGRRVEAFTAAAVPDEEKPEILRAYLKKWAFEVGAFFDGVDARSDREELARIAPKHPVFRLRSADSRNRART